MVEPAAPLPTWIRIVRNPRAVIGGGFILFLFIVAIAAPVLAPNDPLDQDLFAQFTQPFWSENSQPGFPFGADGLGRGVLSRLIYGARVALTVAIVAAFAAGAIGTALGMLAGYLGGCHNVGRARVLGMEAALRGEIWRHGRLTAQATLTDARDRSGIAASRDKQLPLRPRLRVLNFRFYERSTILFPRLTLSFDCFSK